MINIQEIMIGGVPSLSEKQGRRELFCARYTKGLGGEDPLWRTSKTCARKDRSQAINVCTGSRRLVFGDSFDSGSRQVGRQE